MPKVLTGAYKDATFCLPYTPDKTECAFVRPLTESMRNQLRRDATLEAGADATLADRFFARAALKRALSGWQGFYDAAGKEIPFSPEAIDDICACDPDFVAMMLARILGVARCGELDDAKN